MNNPTIKPQVVNSPFTNFCMSIGAIPTSYKDSLDYYETLLWLIKFLDETVIPAVTTNGNAVAELQNLYIELKDYVEHYFKNLDVQEEINNKLDAMVSDGTLDTIISKYILVLPRGNELNLQRIGRKLIYGENSNSYNYNSNGNADTLQGGCILDENTVAYALWDSENVNLNKNKLVIMNLNTGTIQRQEDFVLGWCNSLTYDKTNNKLYVCVRGTTVDDVSSNNGLIEIVNTSDLSIENELNLNINVNSISIYNDLLYALEENTNKIKIFNLDGEYLNEFINLNTDISNLYNQDIKVTKDYIYVLSTKPNNLLNVYNLNGELIESYNIKEYSGLYFIGEVQFIDVISNNDMLLGSTLVNYNEHNNQFFKFNLVNNISIVDINTNKGQSIYCDSESNNYNPDGSSTNPFKSINEASNINLNSIVCICNDKHYKYTYLSNNNYFRLQNAILDEGLHVQYGNYYLENCTIYKNLETNVNADVFIRYANIYFTSVTFDGTDCDYCIYPNGNNMIKFSLPTFSNYNEEVFRTNAPGTIINLNNTNNIPYIPRVNLDYNLFANGSVNIYKIANINYNTDLTADEIATIISNCTQVVIGYIPLNTAVTKEVVFKKTNNNQYTITDVSSSSSTFTMRLAKMILTINNSGVSITSSNSTRLLYENETPTYTLIQAADSSSSGEFIQFQYVKFRP